MGCGIYSPWHNFETKRRKLNIYWFTLHYLKQQVRIIHMVTKMDQYIVQNMTWLEVYLRITFPNTMIQNALTFLMLKET